MKEPGDSELRRTQFVDAAEKLFREKGIVDTTISSIVREVNVAKGLYYYYFKSKDDVIDAVIEKYCREFVQQIQRSLNPADDYDARLDGFIDNTIESFRIMWENLSGANRNIDLTILSFRSMEEAKAIASQALSELLKEGNERSSLNIRNPEYYARMIISGIADLVSQSEADGNEIRRMVRELIGKERY